MVGSICCFPWRSLRCPRPHRAAQHFGGRQQGEIAQAAGRGPTPLCTNVPMPKHGTATVSCAQARGNVGMPGRLRNSWDSERRKENFACKDTSLNVVSRQGIAISLDFQDCISQLSEPHRMKGHARFCRTLPPFLCVLVLSGLS